MMEISSHTRQNSDIWDTTTDIENWLTDPTQTTKLRHYSIRDEDLGEGQVPTVRVENEPRHMYCSKYVSQCVPGFSK